MTAIAAGMWAVIAGATIIGIPAMKNYWLLRQKSKNLRRWAKLALNFANTARPVLAYPLMVNSMLRRRGEEPATGLVMISDYPISPDVMMDIAIEVSSGAASDPKDADASHRLMSDEQFNSNRRRPIPAGVARGLPLYACDLGISPLLLQDGYVSDRSPVIPCLAEPGPVGRIAQLPHWLVAGLPCPSPTHAEHLAQFAYATVAMAEILAGTNKNSSPDAP